MRKSNPIYLLYFIVVMWHPSTAINAHEFWIEPKKFIVSSNEEIIGDLRVGELMEGVSYGYYPKNFRRFDAKTNNAFTPVLGRLGDKPAIRIPAQGNHLVTLIHSTTDNSVQYNDWDKFEKFLDEKNLTNAKTDHLQNNFTKTQFREVYSRYAKALIGSGTSVGIDKIVGLEVELVLKQNPYTDKLVDGLTITLFYKNHPKTNHQIEIFSRKYGQKVTRETIITNQLGEITIKVLPGTDYLINSVIMRRPSRNSIYLKRSKYPLLWESLWASTSFRVPR